jgi:hypothetical protein
MLILTDCYASACGIIRCSSIKAICRLIKSDSVKNDYALWIEEPFLRFTSALSKTMNMVLSPAFSICNMLLDHLENSIISCSERRY